MMIMTRIIGGVIGTGFGYPTSGNAKTQTSAVMSVVSYNTTKQAVEHVLVYA